MPRLRRGAQNKSNKSYLCDGANAAPPAAMDTPFVNIHTHSRTGEGIELVSAMAGAGALPARPCSVGIHPWQVGTPTANFSGKSQDIIILRSDLAGKSDGGETIDSKTVAFPEALRLIAAAAVDAVGEIGLDYARPIPRPAQERVFRDQLTIAAERRLPVVVHCVKAFEPVMDILSDYRLRAVVFHGFIGSRQQALRAVRAGYHLSFGERSLSSPRTVEALQSVPLWAVFLETDESRLPIGEIYGRAAAILGIETGELKKETYKSYISIFGE